MRVGQLVREQQAEMRARDRIEQELAVAQLIQQNFLPKDAARAAGWELAAYYRPARAVGGDFYDFIELADGRIGLVIGDVTDKGVPGGDGDGGDQERAARQRAAAGRPRRGARAGQRQLCPDIPENMFVTCFYGVLEPAIGRASLRQRRPQPAARARRPTMRLGAARDGDAARADARDALRGQGDDDPAGRAGAALQRRARSRHTTLDARCSGPHGRRELLARRGRQRAI